MTAYFVQAFIYLLAAVIAVPLAKRFGLGSVLGYLVAGVVIGPILGLVGQETTTIQHFAEFGVVMMLFLVGLELDPRGLWAMRVRLLGLGGLQVVLTTVAGTAIALWLGLVLQTALAVGLIFALSSTAIVLQTLNEKGLAKTEGGRSAFSVLLFQDIAVIPMLALIPLLALPELMGPVSEGGACQFKFGIGSARLGACFSGRGGYRERYSRGLLFSAVVVSLCDWLWPARNIYRHRPNAGDRYCRPDEFSQFIPRPWRIFCRGWCLPIVSSSTSWKPILNPFKGLLLGLFFITVGAGINFAVLAAEWETILLLGATVIVVKGIILFGLALLFRLHGSNGWLFTLSLAQAGEFGFVLLTYSVQNSVIPSDTSQILSLAVALSMFLTPLLFIAYDRLVLPRYRSAKNDDREADTIEEQAPVIVAGWGGLGRLSAACCVPIIFPLLPWIMRLSRSRTCAK
ncbi:hypothetical protein HSBAA_26270 [Vreelandella sulfidaeris]|uniref:Cation/H+ exchanger transmembrane domain-containing protein n=1 Tax=Vreelandella sulfidaeris TaxID=115553 RepID=A0A455U9T2_9GAMM|nr:hypothetical protein HSBAA_26270 [Halomonas sulfidaeris]